jgi:hypothetical protein
MMAENTEEQTKQYIRSLLAEQMKPQSSDETEAEVKLRKNRIQQELDSFSPSIVREVSQQVDAERDSKAMGSLMVPPEREDYAGGAKVLAKKFLSGAKKIDKKLESKLDEIQGLDDTVIGVSSKTGRPKFATPGETAPEKGVIVGKDRVKIRDTSKTVKGGIYGTGAGALGTAGVAGVLELFDGNEAALISYAQANDDLPSSSEASDFEKAFSKAFKAGEDTFEFKGKTYTTELKRGEKADGGPIDTYDNISPEEEMQQAKDMLPDDEMEEEYVDYVAEEVLEPEEQEYLFKVLDEDPRLEGILDKIILNATEFAGEGEVEGPGTGISDSIPARLSDGEFVITKKATDQIGADNLQKMMDDAERAYDGGLMGMANGGEAGTNPFVNPEEMYGVPKDGEEDIERQMLYSSRMPSLMNR